MNKIDRIAKIKKILILLNMSILEIYGKYQIMPTLQEHMLRVAAVAKMICDNIAPTPASSAGQAPVLSHRERGDIVTAALLHDMGNIIKFDLSQSKNLLNTEIDLEHWRKVQKEFWEKYGHDEHKAHIMIGKEIGVSDRVLELIDCINFDKAKENAEGEDLGKKIIEYSDDRVSPLGVVTLEERLGDLRSRYEYKFQKSGDEEKRLRFENAVRDMEKQIFSLCNIKPEDINNQTVEKEIKLLKKYII